MALAEQQVRYQELLEENRQLQDQHEVSLRDNFEVTEFLRHEILAKDEEISSLHAKMDEVSHSSHDDAAGTTSGCNTIEL